MEGLNRYKLRPVYASIKKMRPGCIVKIGNEIMKTTVSKCFLLTEENGQERLVSKKELSMFRLGSGAEINHTRDLQLHCSVHVTVNTDYFVLAEVVKKQETIIVKDGRESKEIVAEPDDVIVYCMTEDGKPILETKTVFQKEEFDKRFEKVA